MSRRRRHLGFGYRRMRRALADVQPLDAAPLFRDSVQARHIVAHKAQDPSPVPSEPSPCHAREPLKEQITHGSIAARFSSRDEKLKFQHYVVAAPAEDPERSAKEQINP